MAFNKQLNFGLTYIPYAFLVAHIVMIKLCMTSKCSLNVCMITCRVDEDLNIKIADFGLARNVYTNDYYRQQSTGKIPIRWMAPEALHDRISNEKTDVVRT